MMMQRNIQCEYPYKMCTQKIGSTHSLIRMCRFCWNRELLKTIIYLEWKGQMRWKGARKLGRKKKEELMEQKRREMRKKERKWEREEAEGKKKREERERGRREGEQKGWRERRGQWEGAGKREKYRKREKHRKRENNRRWNNPLANGSEWYFMYVLRYYL